MRIIIVGAGEVGSNIASSLASAHEVVVVDRDPERVEELTYSLDVLAKEGDGTSLETLEDAGLDRADLIIASTDVDESNLAICGTAKTVADPFTIARVKNVSLFDTWKRSQNAFSVNFMVCSTSLTAEEVAQVVELPLSLDVDRFAHELVQMTEFRIVEGSPLVGQTIREADRTDALTFAAVLRDDDIIIPHGETTFAAGDKVVVIGSPDGVSEFALLAVPDEMPKDVSNVFVIGGSEVGVHVARRLHDRGIDVRLIEQDERRAAEVAEELPEVVVLNNDATDTEFLERENFGKSSTVVTALENDQKNLMVSLLAKRLGVQRTISVIESEEYRDLFEEVGVDVPINPQILTGEEIARFTREQIAEKLSFIGDDRAEVVEIEVDEESALANRTVEESIAELPDHVVIGAIARDDEMVTPRGQTRIRVGDHVIMFIEADVRERVLAAV
ncbi:Trk system potassium transporter TrkA [Halogeometricum luteum]|uniref:Trk system potassium transporter TrkA n=1 Tax=Halogeometricum luteum TaxID=2950537 RepID=A0ABU2FX92_9EURY|nr:Trk system potassium transporter TrkA [Halogeometricum sp. S3BR5-2]MDS0293155.1 Trk system potassium transporter TrkA [Halogeometricum sp. S3BR5-2]